MSIIYFLVALIATIAGSMAGLGGGVIIKPVLDFLGDYNVSTIGILSAFTVFSMAVVSIYKQLKYKFSINLLRTFAIGMGSICGGLIGEKGLNFILIIVPNEMTVKIVQSSMLILLLVFVLFYMNYKNRFKSYQVSNIFVSFLLGLLLGTLASFLGIGGGPINVAFLTLFFSMDAKEAAINSVLIILFSQSSKLFTVALGTGFSHYDLSMLYVMIPGGILGGLLGSRLNKLASNDQIIMLFNSVVVLVILLNIYNIFTFI
ncbi:MAG: TSUP family transporter [Cellulosilyticaceae bacterium]